MPETRHSKRSRLVDTANRLVHEQGFNRTTLADIAKEANVPLGNVYYYFKTKEEIGHAVIDQRASFYAAQMETWNALPDPRKRIQAFIQMVIDAREMLAHSGCPIGSLCQELHKAGGPLADKAASMFTAVLAWLEGQFRLLGKGKEAPDLALHLLSALEGATLLAHSFNSPEPIQRETDRLKAWIKTL
ncbi:MAG: TetR/AcrR family transcriptional regulator [Chromatiaceae bacterium]|nr:TetR/AcrR family transcriptional regulator [Chromatiaceae bacterium]MBP6733824.1 TetR/AcrR family transcriptional regulator [Chromatiaceae bacterium]MBP6807030.1 TetR/AcrR family transcriptional regulator [Chromatiaceae bacterium]MBP8283084.1 TetR/AcrR family transcriptional regulator [Chromatiaceae bacterium]MBP8288574.1 TetR/AcrR family transcriptional regulator [Chromatiaceae bacterium]